MVLWACGALLNWALNLRRTRTAGAVLYDISKLLMLQPLTTSSLSASELQRASNGHKGASCVRIRSSNGQKGSGSVRICFSNGQKGSGSDRIRSSNGHKGSGSVRIRPSKGHKGSGCDRISSSKRQK